MVKMRRLLRFLSLSSRFHSLFSPHSRLLGSMAAVGGADAKAEGERRSELCILKPTASQTRGAKFQGYRACGARIVQWRARHARREEELNGHRLVGFPGEPGVIFSNGKLLSVWRSAVSAHER
jgi:hypothetical protein